MDMCLTRRFTWTYNGVTGNLNRSQTKSPVTGLYNQLRSCLEHVQGRVATCGVASPADQLQAEKKRIAAKKMRAVSYDFSVDRGS
jgi:hypothetical protein